MMSGDNSPGTVTATAVTLSTTSMDKQMQI